MFATPAGVPAQGDELVSRPGEASLEINNAAILVGMLLVCACVALGITLRNARKAREVRRREERRREATRERDRERELERQSNEREQRIKQQQAERFAAAFQLASFVRKSEDLDLAFHRFSALAGFDPEKNISQKHFVILAMIAVTRIVALHNDRLREIDAEAVTYLARQMFRGKNAQGFESREKIRKLLWTIEAQDSTAVSPITILAELGSPDAEGMKRSIIAFPEMIGANPNREITRRNEGTRLFIASLDRVNSQENAEGRYS